MTIHEPTEEENKAALDSFFTMMRESRESARAAKKNLEHHSMTLVKAICSGSGQSDKVLRIVRSVWNGDNQVGLCDDLCGLDHAIGEAVIALIAARIHMSGDADELIRHILVASGEMARMEKEL
jgi:hypothetical protein